ncbi:MAG: MMPL family transporter [Candidatus Methanomethylophilus sp.]|nr:MMPL family transporter [Methanomethylophilus sp.]
MIFEKLASFVMKHAKLVVIVWIVILLLSVYPALHAGEKLSYSTSSMGSSDTESIEGLILIGQHFESQSDNESMQMVLVVYDNATDAQLTALNNNLIAIPASDSKVSSVIPAGTFTDESGSHMNMYAVSYKTEVNSDGISDDTGNLRNLVRTAASNAFAGSIVAYKTYVTGTPAISYDASQAMSGDMARIDPFSILLILVLVGLFFRSFVTSAAPPITIGVAFALVLCALFFIGQILEIYYIVEMLLIVSMLGAGCDYCIFILSRYREERRRGFGHEDACRDAITWAGEAVFTSGLAVMIGFGSMMVCNFRLVSSMGLGLAIGIIFALLAALTLMSALLVLLGDKLFWPSGAAGPKTKQGYVKKMSGVAHKYFEVSTHFSIKHAKAIIIATILFTIPMVYVYATSEDSYDMIGSMMNGESQEGMTVLTDYAGGGAIMPSYAVIQTTDSLGTVTYLVGDKAQGGLAKLEWSTATSLADTKTELTAITTEVAALNNVQSVYVSSFDGTTGALSNTWTTFASILPLGGAVPGTTDIVSALENNLGPALDAVGMKLPATASAMVGKIEQIFTPEVRFALTGSTTGTIPYDSDLCKGIMDWLLFVETGTLGVSPTETANTYQVNYVNMTMATKEQAMSDTSIVTVSQFRDIVHNHVNANTALKATWITGTAAVMVEIKDVVHTEFLRIEITAIVLIILLLFLVLKSYLTPIRAVVTIFMSVIWTVAITHLLFGSVLHEGVLWILPIILLVICLGLGMDYDILLTTRIREYRFAKGMEHDESIHQAVLHSGSVITICGIIMAGTFGTLMLSSTVMLQQMGFALCFAILIDALVVRTYIVPAAMHLMGDWNWKGPHFMHGKKLPSLSDKESIIEESEEEN